MEHFKYLGYLLKNNNHASAQIYAAATKATRIMKHIWSMGNKYKWTYKMCATTFNAIVKSVILYGSKLWGYKEYEVLEKIQEKYFRWVTKAGKFTPSYIVMEETKRKKIRIQAGMRAMKHEIKLEQAENNEMFLLAECWNLTTKSHSNTGRRDD